MSDSLNDQLLGLGLKPAPKPERRPTPKPSPHPARSGSKAGHGRGKPRPSAEEMDLAKAFALRSAQELCAYLWNNTDANDPEAANVELVAHSDKHAEQLAALLNDARERVDSALHGLELLGSKAP